MYSKTLLNENDIMSFKYKILKPDRKAYESFLLEIVSVWGQMCHHVQVTKDYITNRNPVGSLVMLERIQRRP
jgi:hypothetical protein